MTARHGLLDYPGYKIKMNVSTDVEVTHRLIACAKEPWTVAWLETIPTTAVLYDVGANVGSYTLIAAARGVLTVAIEPSFENYARLCENVILNNLGPKVIPICAALAQANGYALMQQELTPGYSGGAQRLNTLVLTIDTLLQLVPRPTHIKIDVDGGEDGVLAGLFLRADCRPDMLVEHTTTRKSNAEAMLLANGYTLKERWDSRDGHKIKDMWMGLWVQG